MLHFQGEDLEEDEEDGDSDDGEWVDVDHSSDEDEGDGDGEEEDEDEDEESKDKEGSDANVKIDPAELRKQASEVAMSRILTDEDYKRMETLQMQKELVGAKRGSAKKRKASDSVAAVQAAQV